MCGRCECTYDTGYDAAYYWSGVANPVAKVMTGVSCLSYKLVLRDAF